MKLAIYSILTVIAMTGSTYAQNQCGKGAETDESQASSSQSKEDTSEKKDLLTDKES